MELTAFAPNDAVADGPVDNQRGDGKGGSLTQRVAEACGSV
jgi:hypothetical protein